MEITRIYSSSNFTFPSFKAESKQNNLLEKFAKQIAMNGSSQAGLAKKGKKRKVSQVQQMFSAPIQGGTSEAITAEIPSINANQEAAILPGGCVQMDQASIDAIQDLCDLLSLFATISADIVKGFTDPELLALRGAPRLMHAALQCGSKQAVEEVSETLLSFVYMQMGYKDSKECGDFEQALDVLDELEECLEEMTKDLLDEIKQILGERNAEMLSTEIELFRNLGITYVHIDKALLYIELGEKELAQEEAGIARQMADTWIQRESADYDKVRGELLKLATAIECGK